MIFFAESGRLGNQLFQYAALRSIKKPGERLVLLGFDDLAETFDGIEATILPSGHSVTRGFRRIRALADAQMSRLPGVGTIEEETGSHRPVQTGSGRFRYVPEAFFQSESAFDDRAIERLSIAKSVADRASRFIESLPVGGRPIAFMHVRRGDYVRWPDPDSPAVLPASWLRGTLSILRQRMSDPLVIVATDDAPYAQDVLGDEPDVIVAGQSAAVDFAVMARCEAGVLSASSYSWWASHLAARAGGQGPFIAPMHWVGHRSGEWMPSPAIQAKFLEFR